MFEHPKWTRADRRAEDGAGDEALRSATRSLFGDDFWGPEKVNPNPIGPVRPFRLKRAAAGR